jgi:hypothetical protein
MTEPGPAEQLCGLCPSRASVQVHGGIGFTWEHDLHLYHRRAKAKPGPIR